MKLITGGNGEEENNMRGISVSYIRRLFSQQGLKRLFTAWLIAAACCLAGIGTLFTDMKFFSLVKLPLFIALVAVIWLLLCIIKNSRLADLIMLASGAALACLAACEHSEFIFLVGLCAAFSLMLLFVDVKGLRLKCLSRSSFKWSVTLLLALLLISTVSAVCCMYYLNHWTSCFDFGIFSQIFYYLKETGLPLSTCERDGLLSHFAIHASPVFYLLLPLYALFPFPETLLIAQIAMIASGVIPLILICKRLGLADIEGLLFAICYLAYPAFSCGTNYYFHENCFLAPFIMWLLYFCESDRAILSAVFALLTLSVKEDAAIYVAVIALYYLLSSAKNKKRTQFSAAMLLAAVLYFAVITGVLSKYGEGAMTWRYSNYMHGDSKSLMTVLGAIAVNPVYVISQCFTQEKLVFMLQMLLPLGFLPLMAAKPKNLIMLIPLVLINLMTNYAYQYNIGFQYAFGSGAALIFIAAVNYSHLKKKTARHAAPKILVCAASCAVILFVGSYFPRIGYYERYRSDAAERETVNYALSLIPGDASVCSSTFMLPNLSQREEIYQLESTKQTAEYYVLDLRYLTEQFSVDDFASDRYETVFFEEDVIAVFRDTDYTK